MSGLIGTKPITESLIENSKSAILACVELHNKPTFPYRYEVCTILAINGWELLMKAYIAQNHENVKLILKDGTTKPFDECLAFLASNLGKDFKVQEENLLLLYEYRCNIIHFYREFIDPILFSLLHKSIIFYNEFVKHHFNIDLSQESNLILLPIGFKPIMSPIDFLSKESSIKRTSYGVRRFIESIITSTELLHSEGIEESILTGFNIAAINETRIKNADIIAGITKDESKSKLSIPNIYKSVTVTGDEGAKKIRIDEESVFRTFYTLSYNDVIQKCRILYSDFKQNAKFNRIMQKIKGNDKYHKVRYLDYSRKSGTGKDYYTTAIFEEIGKFYSQFTSQ